MQIIARSGRGDDYEQPTVFGDVGFNSRPHMAGDLAITSVSLQSRMFQFTPARGGRPQEIVSFL